VSALTPIICGGCGAAVPLVDAAQQICAFCHHVVVIPPSYLQAVTGRRAAVAARKAAEPKWQRLSSGSSPWWKGIGGALMALAPPTLTAVGFSMQPAHTTAAVFALFTLPSLMPGGVVFVWGATADLTREGYQNALAARPPDKHGAPPNCRECGAPLAVAAGELSCTCLYCGTDSLVSNIPLTAISTERRQALSSLDDATRALRLRLWLVRLALLGVGAFLVGISLALYWAQLRLAQA
jgi:hypothetical protein